MSGTVRSVGAIPFVTGGGHQRNGTVCSSVRFPVSDSTDRNVHPPAKTNVTYSVSCGLEVILEGKGMCK